MDYYVVEQWDYHEHEILFISTNENEAVEYMREKARQRGHYGEISSGYYLKQVVFDEYRSLTITKFTF